MNLTAEQVQAIQLGRSVRISSPEVGADCVVLRADVFDRVKAVLQEDVDQHQVAVLVEQTMREYDEADPLLESYQQQRL